MKRLLRIVLSLLVVLIFCIKTKAQQSLDTGVILKQAYAKAKQEKKNVFVMFTASWCINCHLLRDSLFEHSLTKEIFDDNFVIVYLTALEDKNNKDKENPGATLLYNKFTTENNVGLPFYVVLDPNGKLIGDSFFRPPGADAKTPAENIGRPFMFYEIYAFIELLRKTSNLDSGGALNYLAKYLSRMPPHYFKQP